MSGTTTELIQNATGVERQVFFCPHNIDPELLFVFPENTPTGEMPSGSDVITFNLPSGVGVATGITFDPNSRNLFIADAIGDEIFVVPPNTDDGGTATELRRFNLPNGLTSPASLAISGNDLFIADDAGDEIFCCPRGYR